MGKYSIKELEQLSGIKAHTIRIWEKRHNLISPQRTETNIRYYSDEDLKKIINIALLNHQGVKISRLANMSLEEINQHILKMTETLAETSVYIDQLVVAMVDMEEERFEKILSTLFLRFGFERTITEVVYPFLEKIGVLWQTKNINPAQEHFISNLIRQKIIVAIDSLPMVSSNAKRMLLYLPENELHELGLLFCHYIARNAGFKTYYLGQNVPHEDLLSVIEIHKPDILVSYITSSPYGGVEAYISKLQQNLPKQKIMISGYQVSKILQKTIPNVSLFNNALKFKELITMM
jgi:MerR family transcriptional regulator, light-induced transcriptional regulator